MVGGSGGSPDAGHELGMMGLRSGAEHRRWTRGVWLRVALSLAPFITLVVLAAIFGR
jgi:hypothetical protein